jgi:hypothetical protein
LINVTLEEAEILLVRYQQLMSPGMPFVVLPAGATAQLLQDQRPVLLRAISTVALFHDLPRQQTMVKDLIREIGERMLVNGEKSIDVLQGILVLVGWFHPHIFWCHQLTNLIHLGISLAIEMGVDRAPQQCQQETAGKTPRIPTLAEHRALLGLFFFTSMVSVHPVGPERAMVARQDSLAHHRDKGWMLPANGFTANTPLTYSFPLASRRWTPCPLLLTCSVAW